MHTSWIGYVHVYIHNWMAGLSEVVLTEQNLAGFNTFPIHTHRFPGGWECMFLFLVQVRLETEVLRTPSSILPGFELMTSRS